MLIKHSFDSKFIQLLHDIKKEYGEELFELEGIGEKHLDINMYSKAFFGEMQTTADISVDDNANVSDTSVLSWDAESPKPLKKLNALYLVWKGAKKKYNVTQANKLVKMEICGDLKIHDLHHWKKPYCYATSLTNLVQEGMPFYDKIKIGKVKHFKSFINVSLQYICYMSNMIAGAVAVPDFFAHCDYFVRKDFGEDWYTNDVITNSIKQDFQSWIYSLNFSWRSNQSPFVNVSVFDKYWIKSLFHDHCNEDCSGVNSENMHRLQKLFVEVYQEELAKNLFTFPVMTACILTDSETFECKDTEFLDWISEANTKTGLFNFYISESVDSLSSCCRLRSSLEINKNEYTNSFGVGGLNIGSHRVVTIPLCRIAMETNGLDEFYIKLRKKVSSAHKILTLHRETMLNMIEQKRLPLYNHGHMLLNKQFSTVGLLAVDDAVEMLGYDIRNDDGSAIAFKIFDIINTMNEEYTKETGYISNAETVAAENAAKVAVQKDRLLFPDYPHKHDLYSNQFIGLTKDVDIIERIVAQGKFDKESGGGSILHLNINEMITPTQTKSLIKLCASRGVVYFAINYNHAECTKCKKHYVGIYETSPCCDASVDNYLRVVGFLSKVNAWSKERKAEYKHRVFYKGSDNLLK